MFSKTVKIAVPFIWFGMVLAISFMEAPLKFQAPGVTIPLGLGIGRLVFFTLNKMEIVCAFMLLIAFIRDRTNARTTSVAFGSVMLILILETLWLLPLLDARAEQVIAGTVLPFSNAHVIYIVLDAIKLLLLLFVGIVTTRQLIARGSYETGH